MLYDIIFRCSGRIVLFLTKIVESNFLFVSRFLSCVMSSCETLPMSATCDPSCERASLSEEACLCRLVM